jgi:hypothetical protein
VRDTPGKNLLASLFLIFGLAGTLGSALMLFAGRYGSVDPREAAALSFLCFPAGVVNFVIGWAMLTGRRFGYYAAVFSFIFWLSWLTYSAIVHHQLGPLPVLTGLVDVVALGYLLARRKFLLS